MLRTLRNHLLQIRPHYNAETVNGVLLRNSAVAAALFRAFARPLRSRGRAAPRRDRSRRRGGAQARCERVGSLLDDEILRGVENLLRARAAHQLLPAAGAAGGLDQGRQPQGRRHALAAADVRDLRALAAARGHPPARRQGGARRHPLERPPRRLPHRGPRADEDPDGEERDHRAGRARRAASC